MFEPEGPHLLPGMADNAWNRGISFALDFNMRPDVTQTMSSFGRPPLPEPSTALGSLSSLRREPYISNNVGPGHYAPENEYLRLQKAAFDWEDTQINEGLKLIREHRQPDFAWQETALRKTEEITGFKWEPPKQLQIFPEPTPQPSYLQQAQEAARKTIEAMTKPIFEPPKSTDVNLFPSLAPNTPSYLSQGLELAPILRQTDTETVFKGYGSSHFSYEDHEEYTGFHETTQIPGFGRTEGLTRGLSLHTRITETGDTLSFQEQPLINRGGNRTEKKGLLGNLWDDMKLSLK
jgi:hypothetical protein